MRIFKEKNIPPILGANEGSGWRGTSGVTNSWRGTSGVTNSWWHAH